MSTTQQNHFRPAAAAKLLGISRSTFYRLLRDDPTFPKPHRFGSRITLFRSDDLDAWLASKASV